MPVEETSEQIYASDKIILAIVIFIITLLIGYISNRM